MALPSVNQYHRAFPDSHSFMVIFKGDSFSGVSREDWHKNPVFFALSRQCILQRWTKEQSSSPFPLTSRFTAQGADGIGGIPFQMTLRQSSPRSGSVVTAVAVAAHGNSTAMSSSLMKTLCGSGLIEQEALEPVPVFDFCDQHGRYYTSGYTIRSRGYPEGSCHFLKDRRCRIYEQRPAVCRVYPYMLRQEPDEEGNVDWRQISGLDQHGEYHTAISGEDALRIANQTRLFEEAAIAHEIAYLDFTGRYFLDHGLRNVRKKFDDGLRSAERGEEIEVMVFFQGAFEPWIIKAGTAVQRSASRR